MNNNFFLCLIFHLILYIWNFRIPSRGYQICVLHFFFLSIYVLLFIAIQRQLTCCRSHIRFREGRTGGWWVVRDEIEQIKSRKVMSTCVENMLFKNRTIGGKKLENKLNYYEDFLQMRILVKFLYDFVCCLLLLCHGRKNWKYCAEFCDSPAHTHILYTLVSRTDPFDTSTFCQPNPQQSNIPKRNEILDIFFCMCNTFKFFTQKLCYNSSEIRWVKFQTFPIAQQQM